MTRLDRTRSGSADCNNALCAAYGKGGRHSRHMHRVTWSLAYVHVPCSLLPSFHAVPFLASRFPPSTGRACFSNRLSDIFDHPSKHFVVAFQNYPFGFHGNYSGTPSETYLHVSLTIGHLLFLVTYFKSREILVRRY